MRRIVLATLSLAIFFSPRASAQRTYSPAEVTSAGDAYTSFNVVFDGLFVLDVEIGDDGGVRRIEPLRNPGGMFETAKNLVSGWKFRPASKGGKPRASRLTVAFVYRPPNYIAFGAVPVKDFSPVIPSERSNDCCKGYAPVGVLSFAYPDYPVNSVAWGSVILQATVDSTGGVESVDVLHGMPNFDRFAREALKNWRFRAARASGRPVTAKIVIAFIFQPPPSSH